MILLTKVNKANIDNQFFFNIVSFMNLLLIEVSMNYDYKYQEIFVNKTIK